jgi:protein-disulfide isomerase
LAVTGLLLYNYLYVVPNASAPDVVSLGRLLPVPAEPIALADSPQLGDLEAPVIAMIFSDFQCPYCGAFARTEFQELMDSYVRHGQLRFVFRNFPLASIHPRALQAAHAGACANKQGRFWELHDTLFRNQTRLDGEHLDEMAQSVGVDMSRFRSCLSADATVVHRDVLLGQRLRIKSTPTFVFGVRAADDFMVARRIVVGVMTISQFQEVINELLESP